MFNESYNSAVKKDQRHLQFRFWNEEKGQLDTRYYKSEKSSDKSSAGDVFEKFNSCCSELPKENIIEVSSLLYVFIKVHCCSRIFEQDITSKTNAGD